MGKRFTDTDKWKDDWFLSLDNDYRIVWQYMLDNCTNAARLKKNFKLMNFCCNVKLDEKSFTEVFGDRVIDMGDFYFIPKFIRFQYPKGLSSHKPQIRGIVKELVQYKLVDVLIQSLGNDYPMVMETETETETEKEKETDKDKDKRIVKGKPEYSAEFDCLWAMYPRQEGKKEAYRHYLASVLTNQDKVDIKKAVDNYCAHIKREKTELRYIKQGSTFFNNWRDYVNFSGQPIRQETRYGNFV